MLSFSTYILTAFALVFVIEGLFYALFPDQLRKMMTLALSLPVSQLRLFGISAVSTGFLCLLLIRFFTG
ncbi:MAG: DUF2065 domain-containing protein [Alphaproteobacteria bacterium]|nr:DUF2065 domain-containing protein [Alphaproteobacteria bacterium]